MDGALDEILADIKKRYSDDGNLLSLTVVGSLAYPQKLLKFNDLDIIIVFRKLDKTKLAQIRRYSIRLEDKFSSKMLGITSSFKIGPIKKMSGRPKTLMLHFLVFSEKSYKAFPSNLVKYSFQRNKPLLGKSLKQIQVVKRPKPKDLQTDIFGFKIKGFIETGRAAYFLPLSDKIFSYKLNQKQHADIMMYSCLRIAENMIGVKGYPVGDMESICRQFKKSVPVKLRNLPLEIYRTKLNVRSGDKLSVKEIRDIKVKSLEFIYQCEELLSKE